jgi:hypothetical protein
MPTDPVRACPSCAALAQARQRWCLECGAELPPVRRGGLRPAVGIATVLALLVGAASAGGYTLLRHQAQPPPPATTVAAQTTPTTVPPATTTPGASSFTPPSSYSTPSAPAYKPVPLPGTSSSTRGTFGATHGNTGGAPAAIPHTGRGSATPTAPPTTPPTTPTTPKPQLALTDVALGAAAVVYAPYASASADLGDASRVVDGTTRTAWRTPSFDAGARPQMGVYVDLASAQKLRKLVLATPTPGMSVEIYGATQGPPDSITAPGWTHLASRGGIGASTTIGLGDRSERYVLVWIVGLPSGATSAAISELSLLSLQPE